MTRKRTIVIVGASLAGAKAAETLRLEGFDGRLVLIGEETQRPYKRPALSKERLRREPDSGSIFVHDEAFYANNGIELRTSTRVTDLDPIGSQIQTGDGERIGYDRLLLATGARPRLLNVPGSHLAGIHYLRTVEDCDRLSDALSSATRLVVIGAGWIGSEVAASARQLGVEVALVDPLGAPLERVLGSEVGAVYRDLHADHGVELHLNTSVDAFIGEDSVEGVRTSAGSALAADVVVIGVGAEPRAELAAAAGLYAEDGIAVNEHLQSSSSRIYAAGDVAAAWDSRFRRRIRVEHWANALNQGIVAAKNMLGAGRAYDRIPFSDQYDLGMEYAGHATSWERHVFRGDPASGQFIAVWLGRGRVLAGMNVNVWDVNDTIQTLIRSKWPVDVDRLRDPNIPLDQVLSAAAA